MCENQKGHKIFCSTNSLTCNDEKDKIGGGGMPREEWSMNSNDRCNFDP